MWPYQAGKGFDGYPKYVNISGNSVPRPDIRKQQNSEGKPAFEIARK